MELVEVELSRVVIHQKGDQQYIHLRERRGNRGFPIVIGYHEVEEINRKLCGVQPPRPLTHDLVGRILLALGHRLHRVIINNERLCYRHLQGVCTKYLGGNKIIFFSFSFAGSDIM